MTDGPLTLVDPDDFPALYRSADRTSLAAQRRFLVALRFRLGGLLLAAVGGAISWSVGSVEFGGLLALVAFAVALAAESYSALTRPDRAWYEGRAAAESVKTLTWRFAVRGESFEAGGAEAEKRFLDGLDEILQDLDSVEPSSAEGQASQITTAMRDLRSRDFLARRDSYLHGRIRDQQAWYARNARTNARLGHRWLIAGIAFEFLGVIGGALRAFGGVDVDLLGVLAAVAAAITAWVQAKQHDNLSTAYGVTAQELASVASEVEAITPADEGAWGHFVGEAEEAISREHTLWRASRGLRIRRPGRPTGS